MRRMRHRPVVRCALLPVALASLALLALVSPGFAQDPRLLDAGFLDTLRAEVRTNHPSVAASQARVLAAEAGVRAVRLWEDPTANAGIMAADQEMRRGDGDLILGVEQMLPRRKLYEARKARAGAERAIFEAETRTAALNLETLVAQSAIELALVDEMLAIETNQLAWLESMAANAREKLKDPMANASEPLRIESEASPALDAPAQHSPGPRGGRSVVRVALAGIGFAHARVDRRVESALSGQPNAPRTAEHRRGRSRGNRSGATRAQSHFFRWGGVERLFGR